jgi:glutamate racemase
MRVGVFDSGVGGLSILEAISAVLPGATYSYCCDSLNFPYGTKTESAVVDCASQVTKKFYDHAGIDVLVIACNTASTVALPQIRHMLPIPVVGVVPAVKPAAERSQSKVIGVLATPATVSRPYLDSLIHEFAKDCRVVKCGSSELVQLAERKLRGEVISIEDVRRELSPIIDALPLGLDQLVLGCTHFPLIADELRRVLPTSVSFVDSGQAVASRVQSIFRDLEQKHIKGRSSSADKLSGWCSGPTFSLTAPGNLGNLILHTLP